MLLGENGKVLKRNILTLFFEGGPLPSVPPITHPKTSPKPLKFCPICLTNTIKLVSESEANPNNNLRLLFNKQSMLGSKK